MTDASVFLLIAVIVVSVLIMVAVIFLMVYYGHPDDQNENYLPKFIVLFALWLPFCIILILPYDIANSRAGNPLRLDILWQLVYISAACMVCAVIPFAFFFYESDEEDDDGKPTSPLMEAIKGTFMTATFFFVLCGILYAFISVAQIPVRRYVQNQTVAYLSNVQVAVLAIGQTCASTSCQSDSIIWNISVSFAIYIIALLCFIGWWFFTLFVGVGFVALPLDLIHAFRTRPVKMDAAQYVEAKRNLGNEARALLDVGIKLQKEGRDLAAKGASGYKRKHAAALRAFEQNYYFLKRNIDVLKISYDLKGGNPLFYYVQGFFGVIAAGLTVTWFIHIVIFILPPYPVSPFLNTFFIVLEDNVNGFTLFGIIAYAIWSMYLLWCCVKGNFKLGIRFLFIKVYPMEVGNTFVSGFLANAWILLLCCVPIIQFCVVAFPYYSRQTQVDLLFGTQIKYLEFFKYFWVNDVFIFMIVILMGLTGLYLMARPNDKAAEIEGKIAAVARGERRVK